MDTVRQLDELTVKETFWVRPSSGGLPLLQPSSCRRAVAKRSFFIEGKKEGLSV
jgi:hypothetical protein